MRGKKSDNTITATNLRSVLVFSRPMWGNGTLWSTEIKLFCSESICQSASILTANKTAVLFHKIDFGKQLRLWSDTPEKTTVDPAWKT